MFRRIVFVVASLLVPVWAEGQGATDSLTVDECVALARRAAPAVRAAGLEAVAARSDSTAAAVNHRPAVSVLAGAWVAPDGFYDPTITNLGEYELKLSLDWTATDGGRLARARRRGELDTRAADQRAAAEIRDAGLEAARLAIRALRLQREVLAQERTLDGIDRLARLVRAGVSSGTRSSTDSTRVDLERDGVASSLEQTRLDARSALLELSVLLGRAEDSLAVREADPNGGRAPIEADSVRLMQLVERLPEVALARTLAARSELDAIDAARAKSPTVSFTVDAGLAGADLTRLVPPNLLEENPDATFSDRLVRDLGASAAVHVRLPVIDATAKPNARAREAAQRAEEVRSVAAATRLRQETLTLLARWRVAYRTVEAARRTKERAEANLLRVKSLYSAGATRLLDLLDAQRVYEESRQRLDDAQAENRLLQFEAEDRR